MLVLAHAGGANEEGSVDCSSRRAGGTNCGMTEEEASTYFAKKAELGRNWEGGEEKAGHVLKKKGGGDGGLAAF